MAELSPVSTRSARLFPEIIPATTVKSISSGNQDFFLELPRLADEWVIFNDFASDIPATPGTAFLEIRNDRKSFDIDVSGLQVVGNDLNPTTFNVLAIDFINALIRAPGGVSDFKINHTLTIFRPSVAHKILHGQPLETDEQRIAERLNLHEEVEKGLAPVPLNTLFNREYQLVDGRRTHNTVNGISSGVSTIATFVADRGEIVVIEKISVDTPASVSDNFRILIDRDDDTNYVDIDGIALNMADDVDMNIFIPALREIKIKTSADASVGSTKIRYTIAKYKLTDILRIRFGLVDRGDVTNDTFDMVRAGVL